MNSLVIILAGVALLLKAWVLFRVANAWLFNRAFIRKKSALLFLGLTAVFSLINLFTLIIDANVNNLSSIEWLVRPNYVWILLSMVIISVYASNAAQLGRIWHLTAKVLTIVSLVPIVLIMSTDLVIHGAMSIGYSVTAIKGDLFHLYLLFVAICFLYTLTTLLVGMLTARTELAKKRCLYTMIALLPIIIAGASVGLTLYLGININGSGLFPMATSLFLIITLKTEHVHGLTNVRRLLPFSPEFKATNDLLTLFSKYTMDEITYKELKSGIESIAVEYKFVKKGNVSETARAMGLNRSTVSAMVNKHQLKE